VHSETKISVAKLAPDAEVTGCALVVSAANDPAADAGLWL
jgi:hypothetical protein